MDWVLHHLQLIIAIAGMIAWWLSQNKAKQAGQDESQPDKSFDDPVLAERTRRIREEIQRKIEQRNRGYVPPPPVQSEPELAELPPVLRELVGMQKPAPPPPPPLPDNTALLAQENQRAAEILEQQSAMMEQLRQAAEMKASAVRRTRFETHESDGGGLTAVTRDALMNDLGSADALRRAFILREILGPPVALR